MVKKRIIPCLDIKDGAVVKGVCFEDLRTMGDPAMHASYYSSDEADEVVVLDISASHEKRKTMMKVVEAVADAIHIPLTVGGGVTSVDDVRCLLRSGADRVSLNTAAVNDPALISRTAEQFGSQCIVVAIDARWQEARKGWDVYVMGGRTRTTHDVIAWSKIVAGRGAGEILLTSMDRDGTMEGYDLELLKRVAEAVPIPVIASGGAGKPGHFLDAFTKGKADAVLAASLFHSRAITIPGLKSYLRSEGIEIR